MIEPMEKIEDPDVPGCAFCGALLGEIKDPRDWNFRGFCDAVCSAKRLMQIMEKADFRRPVHIDYVEQYSTYQALVAEIETLRTQRFTIGEAAYLASGILGEMADARKLGTNPLPDDLLNAVQKVNQLLIADIQKQ